MMLSHQGFQASKPPSPSSSSDSGSLFSNEDADGFPSAHSPSRKSLSPPFKKRRHEVNGDRSSPLEQQQQQQNALNNNYFYRPPFAYPSSLYSTPERPLLQLPLMAGYRGYTTPGMPTSADLKKRKLYSSIDRLSDDDGSSIDVVGGNTSSDKDTDCSMRTADSSPESSSSLRSGPEARPRQDTPPSPSLASPDKPHTVSPEMAGPDAKRKSRTNYTPDQVQKLEKEFHENPYPDSEKMEAISRDIGIAEGKIKVWFQNKRARWRRRVHECPRIFPTSFISPMMSPVGAPYGYIPGSQLFPASSSTAMSSPYFGIPLQSSPNPVAHAAPSSPTPTGAPQSSSSSLPRGQYPPAPYGFYPYPYGVISSPYF